MFDIWMWGATASLIVMVPTLLIAELNGAGETTVFGYMAVIMIIVLWPLMGPLLILYALGLWIVRFRQHSKSIRERTNKMYADNNIVKMRGDNDYDTNH